MPVSAVFVVGGGGKITGFTDYLADKLKLSHDRVALRGQEVMNDINFLVENVKKDSLYVTPVGICLSFFDQKNNFIFVNVNGNRVKLYNNDRLTIFDAAVQYGLPNESLFPKRGADITFKVNGKSRIVRGYNGEAAVIKQNGNIVGMNAIIEANDKIEITESTAGEPAKIELGSLPEFNGKLTFTVNGAEITCPKFAVVNGKPETQYYNICDGDDIEMQAYYTVEQLLYFMDVSPAGKIYINNSEASTNDKIYENFVVTWKDDIEFEDLKEEITDNESDNFRDEASVSSVALNETELTKEQKKTVDLHIIVNKVPVTLHGKSDYVFVDVFDFYDFDLENVKGSKLNTKVNGHPADYMESINEGSVIEIYWEK